MFLLVYVTVKYNLSNSISEQYLIFKDTFISVYRFFILSQKNSITKKKQHLHQSKRSMNHKKSPITKSLDHCTKH